jgi:hypothetical protein
VTPNPYEPPREPEPLTKAKLIKRGTAVAVILLLTPPAFAIAVGVSCTATVFNRMPFAALFVPLVVVIVLTSVAATLTGRENGGSKWPKRARILWMTPWVIVGAYIAGLVLAMVTSLIVGEIAGDLGPAMSATMIAFWIPPAIALSAMMWLAWKTR